MHCIDETHCDWMGSDEVDVITSAVHISRGGANNIVRTERMPLQAGQSGTYGGVDSHDTRIGPPGGSVERGRGRRPARHVADHGLLRARLRQPGPFREEADAAVKLAIAIATYLYPPAGAILALIEASGLVTDFFNWILSTGDDEIGTNVTVLEFEDLENYSRTRQTDYRESRTSARGTGLMYHFLGSVNDNDYLAAYIVTRNPSAPLFQTVVE